MKIKIAVEFEKEIEGDNNYYASSTKDDIVRAVVEEHPELKPTGEWMFITSMDKGYGVGVLYED